MHKEKLYLAADSGGSKTLWTLITENADILFEYRTQGVGAVRANIMPVYDIAMEAATKLKIYGEVTGIYFSLGGANTEEVRSVLESIWGDIPITVERESNGNAILYAASFLGCSSVVMCGTGSVAVGDTSEGRKYGGGWGPLYGDGGAGGGMGRDALCLFLRAVDGMEDIGEVYGLFSHLTEGLAIGKYADRMELKRRALDMSRRELAALASQIYLLAEKGDKCAIRLYEKAAQEVALLAKNVSDQTTKNVLLCGGFFMGKPFFLELCREAYSRYSDAVLCYNEKFSPITAASISVLKTNGSIVNAELFKKILNTERKKSKHE